MICFFWDLTSLRKSSMKSSGFGWEASSAVELLAAVFLAADEFCANAELVAANATNIRVITRNFLWFTGSFLTTKRELGASAARNCRQRELSSMHNSNRATSCISQPEQVSHGRGGHCLLWNSETTNLQGMAQWHTVSSVTCHMT